MAVVLSVKKAAERLGLGYGRVIKLIRKGELKAQKPEGGWGWMVDSQSVEDYKCKTR